MRLVGQCDDLPTQLIASLLTDHLSYVTDQVTVRQAHQNLNGLV